MNLNLTEDLYLGQLADMIATGGTLDGAKLHLTQEDLSPDPLTPLGDWTAAEADFHGYAAGAVTWLAASRADDGSIELIGTVPEFRFTAGVPENDVFNAYLTDTGATKLFAVARFDDPPIPFHATTDSAMLTIRYRPASGSLIVVVS